MKKISFDMACEGYESFGTNTTFVKVPRELHNYISAKLHTFDEGRILYLLASRVAIKTGYAHYAGHTNFVVQGAWSGGIVGLRAILGIKSLTADKAIAILTLLQDKGYLTFSVTGKLIEYSITGMSNTGDSVEYFVDAMDTRKTKNGGRFCPGATITRYNSTFIQEGFTKNYNKNSANLKISWQQPCHVDNKTPSQLYVFDNKGWFPLYKNILDIRATNLSERKKAINRCSRTKHQAEPFSEGEAFFDLYVHTVRRDFYNAFSWFAPAVMINDMPTVSYQALADRWGWTKSKVQRFFVKHFDIFRVLKLNRNCGSVIYNLSMSKHGDKLPHRRTIQRILRLLVTPGKRDKKYANDEIVSKSKAYIKKYFCETRYYQRGNARQVYGITGSSRYADMYQGNFLQNYDAFSPTIKQIREALHLDSGGYCVA